MSPRFPCLSMLADTHTCPFGGKLALSVEQQERLEQKGKGQGKTEKEKNDEKGLEGERKKLKFKAS